MNNNEIKNPKVEVPTGMALNDKDYLNSILGCLKELVKNYAVTLTEASNEKIHGIYKEMFNQYLGLQRRTYELMFQKGWYILESAEIMKINGKYQTLNQEFMDLSN